MSRFDNEMVKHADNAYQLRGLSGQTTTPRQQPYDQVNTVGTDQAPGVTQAPAPANETAGWVAEMPMMRQLDVRDLDAADPMGDQGEIIGGPGSSAVYAEGQPMYASTNPIDESLYQVYKASRDIRNAINEQIDFDFSNLVTASNDASTVLRFASNDDNIKQVIGTVASLVLDIETDLAAFGDYRQASVDLKALEGLLQDIKTAATGEEEDPENDGDKDDKTKGTTGAKKKPKAKKKDCKNCKGKGCDDCEDDDEDDDDKPAFLKKKKASNGNQESLQVVDVRDLDDQAGVWDRQRVMQPDHTTNVLVPEEVNGEDAGYVQFYNDGSSTGITPGDEPHKTEVWPYDGTNPAFVPYQSVAGAVQASREKLFAAIQVVDRLEKLGMAREEDRAKHIAKFEQMSNAKLAGFVASMELFEESGARQPRSQKVAKGNNSLPEMGRLTTASTVTRQDIQSDDWLMTL
jgi:hypothetical protein